MKKLMFVVAFAIASVVSVNVKAETPKANKEYSFSTNENSNASAVTTVDRAYVIAYLQENGFYSIYPGYVNPKPGTVADWYAAVAFYEGQHYHVTIYVTNDEIVGYDKVLY